MTHKTHKRDRKYTTILGVQVNSTSTSSVLTWVEGWISKKERFFIVTPNPEIVMLAHDETVLFRSPTSSRTRNKLSLYRILNRADISLPDGIGLVWASRFQAWRSRVFAQATLFSKTLGALLSVINRFTRAPRLDPLQTSILKDKTQTLSASSALHFSKRLPSQTASPLFTNHQSLINNRVSGIDVMEALIGLASKRGWRVFLLGGRSGVAAQAAYKLKNELEIRNLKLEIQADSGPWLDTDGKPVNKIETEKEKKAIEEINKFKPHLLFVGLGAPKQEKWVASNYNKLQTLGTMVVGGAFDYISGRIPRAPAWLRNVGLEWLFRLIVEPWRWKRQFTLLKFIFAIIKG